MGVRKAAMEALVRALARRHGRDLVRVNAVSAGPLSTVAASKIPGFSQLSEVWDATLFLLRNRRAILAADFALACVQWLCRYGVLPILVMSFGCHINPFPLIMLQGLLFAVSIVLVAPGGGAKSKS